MPTTQVPENRHIQPEAPAAAPALDPVATARQVAGHIGKALEAAQRAGATVTLPLAVRSTADVAAVAEAVAAAVAAGRCTSSAADVILKAARLSWDVVRQDQEAELAALRRRVAELERIVEG